jgi:uncharacterized delta-60 repeat protein
VARYTSSGALDTSFSSDGEVEIDFGSFNQTAYQVIVQLDGKIVTAGYPNTESSDSDFLLARCNSDGSLDGTFGTGGKVRTSFGQLNGGAYGAVLQPDSKIVAVGFNATSMPVGVDFALARYLGDSAAWVDHAGPLAGTPGLPVLYGTGDLSAGSANSIVLHNANSSALAGLFLAFSSMPVPFMGGILQPFPFVSVFVATTSPTGTIAVPFTMPSGVPTDTHLWLQWAIVDAGAVQGVALSNAIEGITP